ncbi:MAG TPA: hypothetical protein VH575_36885 [Gemmataceae bacterium]
MKSRRPLLTVKKILAWAEAYREQTGRRPNGHSEAIPEMAEETWAAIDTALAYGYRGLRGGLSLVELLNRHWGKMPRRDKPPLSVEQILVWAEAYYRRTGKWPTAASGVVEDAPEETWEKITWRKIDNALREGYRGLPGENSLSRLLRQHQV